MWVLETAAATARNGALVLSEPVQKHGSEVVDSVSALGRVATGELPPPEAICALRTLWRHRGSLLEMAAEHILHMQKALSQMNLQLQHVLSDITGTSGQAILDAIL